MRDDLEMVGRSLGMEPALVPLAPALLRPFEALGSDADSVVEALVEVGLPPGAQVLDAGCGKGAVAIEIARRLPVRVHGVDLLAPFVEHARAAAGSAGVADRCTFACAAVDTLEGPVDALVYAALGDVLGPWDVTVGVLRRAVRPGGHLLIQDAYRKVGAPPPPPGCEGYVELPTVRRLLAAHGDELVLEWLDAYEDDASEEARWLEERARALADRHPEAREALLAFSARQAGLFTYLAAYAAGGTWVLRRSA